MKMTSERVINSTVIACPACKVPAGNWCERHGQVQAGELLACVARQRAARMVPCPVGQVANDPHDFVRGTGVEVEWHVMGDPRTSVEVCAECARGVDRCEICGNDASHWPVCDDGSAYCCGCYGCDCKGDE